MLCSAENGICFEIAFVPLYCQRSHEPRQKHEIRQCTENVKVQHVPCKVGSSLL